MIKRIPLLIFMLFFLNSCKRPAKIDSPPGYDLTRPEILKMPSELNEISGIAFKAGNPDTLYAEQDEAGRIFYFPTASLDVKHINFGKKGDYEDITILNGTIIILRSDGVLFSFPLKNLAGDEDISNVIETAGILPAGEYEALYAEQSSNLLYVLCKNCNGDKPAKSISGHILQLSPGKGIELKSDFQVNTMDIAAKLNEKKIILRPSALAKNNRNNEWYLLSSVNKLLVVTDDQWVIKEVYSLDPTLFNQPEGIAFDRDDNLYISNERGSAGSATVLKFNFSNDKK